MARREQPVIDRRRTPSLPDLDLQSVSPNQRTQRITHRPTPHTPPPDAATRAVDHSQMQTQVQNRKHLTTALENMLALPRRDSAVIKIEHLLALLIVGLLFFVRIANLSYNTLHLDEAIYATVGEEFVGGVYTQGATQWMYGSYLYPLLAAVSDSLGGVVGLRLLSAGLSTVAAVFVYLTTARIFGGRSAVIALLIFGFTGISINMGQFATYDALGLPLLGATMYCCASAMLVSERRRTWLRLAGIAYSLCVLAKYNAVLLLPALLVGMFMLHLSQRGGLRSFITGIPWDHALVPMVIILGIYGAYYQQDIRHLFSSSYNQQTEPLGRILGNVVRDIGVYSVLAALTLVMRVRRVAPRLQRGALLLFGLSIPLFLATVHALPLYHLAAGNGRSLWKHDVYTLMLLAPVAGCGVAALISATHTLRQPGYRLVRLVGASLTALLLFWFISDAFLQNRAFAEQWPRSDKVIAFMRQQGIDADSRVLSSGYAIYDYYFDLGVHDQGVWSNIWYTTYGDLTGTDAVRQSIQACAFDYLVLDNYWSPEYAGELMYRAQAAGYIVAFSDSQTVSTGDVIVTYVYTPSASGCPAQPAQEANT